jgi:hypothetical protein
MIYSRLCIGLNDRGYLVPSKNLQEYIKNTEKDAYCSIYQYNELHYKHFLEHNTIAGITDVTTNRLVFDFDSFSNLSLAQKDAITVIDRLQNDFKIPLNAIQIYFSGKKGFTVCVETNLSFFPPQLKELCYNKIGKNLNTLDNTLYNASRILRIPWTKHQESGLYKIPISFSCLINQSISDIQKLASNLDNVEELEYNLAILDESIIPIIKEKPKLTSISTNFLDFTVKPRFLSNCRWSLQNGRFYDGDRSNALLCLGATYKNLGFTIDHNYRLLKGVAELQAKYTQSERFSDEEIYNNIITQIYSPNWGNGQFSCRNKDSWLYEYCQSLGVHACIHDNDKLTIKSNDVFQLFYEYTQNYDKNILSTGIKELDDKVKLMVGTSNAIVGPPGVGKTSLIFEILNYNSKMNIPCIFFSYDMFHAPVYMRLIQKHTGKSQEEIYNIFKHNPKKAEEFQNIINTEYKNVEFCFKSGQTPDEIIETIRVTNEKLGNQRVKLIIVDYNELVIPSVSDPTAGSAQVAQKLRQIANEQEVCVVTLLQPSKMYTNPTEDIKSFTAAKGSSAIAQSLTLMLGLSRPGYNSRFPEIDKYFTISCLKNRNGSQFALDFSWDGLKGKIDSLTQEERFGLEQLRESLKKNAEGDFKKQYGF